MANKRIFIAFAIEDESQRNLLKGQSLLTTSPFDYIDLSVKEAYVEGWKDKVRTRIKGSDGVIVLISKNSVNSSGQKWEVQCTKEEKKKILCIWAYSNDTTEIPGLTIRAWAWDNIKNFINSL